MNPLKGACSKKNCKYRFFLRKYSIFGNFQKIPVQILMYIIEQFIIEKINASLIRKAIKNKYNETNLNIRAIYKFMKTIRQCIAEYLNNIYEEEDISTQNNNNYFAVDESLFTTIDNSPQWVVGIISTTDRTKFRCNITTTRNANYLRNFITRYI